MIREKMEAESQFYQCFKIIFKMIDGMLISLRQLIMQGLLLFSIFIISALELLDSNNTIGSILLAYPIVLLPGRLQLYYPSSRYFTLTLIIIIQRGREEKNTSHTGERNYI